MPAPNMEPPRREQEGKEQRQKRPRSKWRLPILYGLLTLWLLWTWQAAFREARIEEIPYSKFKQYLARGQVVECVIEPEHVRGKIDPTIEPAAPQANGQAEADKTERSGTDAEPGAADNSGKATESPIPQEAQQQPDSATGAGKAEEDKAKQGEEKDDAEPKEPFTFRSVRVDDPELVKQLEERNVEFTGVVPSKLGEFLFAWIIPIGIMVLIWFGLSRMLGRAGGQVMSFGKSKAKIVADRSTGVTFKDVAGCDEAKFELEEVVDFLKNPKRYEAVGAKIPKGALLIGPPGTGKTLLARAVAGEAGAPFFSLSGSDFVEMFVGVGASRVRDLFVQAKEKAPCIIFIDELDAIGRQRGVHVGAVNDEREQTLNQLLAEMDGFDPNIGVIILAATNRPEVLDKALMRPGRFDRQIVVDAPDVDGREAILKVHSAGKAMAPDVDLRKIARATPGFSGADLANALNEAGLLAVRRAGDVITQADLEEAVEKVVAGPERKSRRLNEEEKRRVAYHEVGHALVATYCEHADPVHKISIVPRGRTALGYTLQLPTEDQFLMTEQELTDRLKGMLGGRAAEEVILGDVSTGAQNDLERATALARQMVCVYGMSKKIGLTHCVQPDGQFLQGPGIQQRDCSEQTAREIDEEVRRILDECYGDAVGILTHHRDELERIAGELLRRETLDRRMFDELRKSVRNPDESHDEKTVGSGKT